MNNLPESSRHYVELFSHALMHLRTLRSSTPLLHALRKSKQTVRTSTSLVYPLQKTKRTLRFSTSLLHALRKFKWSIQTSSRLLHVCNSRNPLSEVLQASYTLALIFYKPPTRIAEVKMHYPNYYMPPTRFVEDETDSRNIYKLP